MGERVVVLGAGYAGTVAIRRLERRLDPRDLTWVSETDYHLVRHEVHRAIRDPAVREKITIPVEDIRDPDTTFVQGRVVGLDPSARRVALASGVDVDYDYLVVALGSDTAFYGIPGLADRAHTLGGLDDAIGIHEAVCEAAVAASRADPARIALGGAGLSGVQAAGEVAALRDAAALPAEVTLVEALPEILPDADPPIRRRIRRLLAARGVSVVTDDPIVEVEPDELHFAERAPLPYDVFVWTGGITGPQVLAGTPIENHHGRLVADPTCRTSDDRVFAVGDAAVVRLDGEAAPATAQVARDAAEIAAANVAREIDGLPARRWSYRDVGTLISVGDAAVAHDVAYLPAGTFGGPAASFLKKFVAARWIAQVTSWRRGLAAWDAL